MLDFLNDLSTGCKCTMLGTLALGIGLGISRHVDKKETMAMIAAADEEDENPTVVDPTPSGIPQNPMTPPAAQPQI